MKEIKTIDDMINGAVTKRFHAALRTVLKNIIGEWLAKELSVLPVKVIA